MIWRVSVGLVLPSTPRHFQRGHPVQGLVGHHAYDCQRKHEAKSSKRKTTVRSSGFSSIGTMDSSNG